MISQRCPKCNSSRVRAGYRPTPFWLKLLFRYYLLCNSCNWEFTGFAVPGTVSAKTKPGKKKQSAAITLADKKDNAETIEKNTTADDERVRTKKRVKIKIRA